MQSMLCRPQECNDRFRGLSLRRMALLITSITCFPLLSLAHDQEIEGETEDLPPSQHAPCVEGTSSGYLCSNMELVHFVPVLSLNSTSMNDVWGWTDPLTGEEYAIVGLRNGTAFIHINEFGHPTYLGRLPTNSFQSSWRDIKVYDNHAYIVSEAPRHGMQVFDLTRLRAVDPANAPVTFFLSNFVYQGIGSAHNVVINEDTGFAYAVGAGSCSGGLHMIDIEIPARPQFAGCFGQDRYTHDAQCVIYHGPDADYQGREICFNSNEDTVTIADVTDKAAPVMIVRAPYFGSAYTHQGWLTEDHAHFLLDDELDERRSAGNTRTFVWDMSDLDAPFVTGVHRGATTSIDHNQYVLGNHVFQANYRSGIRVLRLGDLSEGELAEVAYFDTTPSDDLPAFSGTWSVYPYFKSGYIVATDINRGLYILWPRLDAISECSDGIDNDGDGQRDFGEDPTCWGPNARSESERFDVQLTIDPRRAHRKLFAGRRARLYLAIPGSDTVDVEKIDLESLRFHPGDITPKIRNRKKSRHLKDLNGDQRPDVPLRIRLDKAALEEGVQDVCVSGLLAGDPFEACVTVEIFSKRHPRSKHHKGKKRVAKPSINAAGAVTANEVQNMKSRSKAEKNQNAPDHPL